MRTHIDRSLRPSILRLPQVGEWLRLTAMAVAWAASLWLTGYLASAEDRHMAHVVDVAENPAEASQGAADPLDATQ